MSKLDQLAATSRTTDTTQKASPPEQATTSTQEKTAQQTTSKQSARRPAMTTAAPQPDTGKKTINIRLTQSSRKAIDDEVTADNNIDSLGMSIIAALRATEQQLREQAPAPTDPNDPWADETNPQRQLTIPDGETPAPTAPRFSPGQRQALRRLADDLGWSPSLVCDTAIRLHHNLD